MYQGPLPSKKELTIQFKTSTIFFNATPTPATKFFWRDENNNDIAYILYTLFYNSAWCVGSPFFSPSVAIRQSSQIICRATQQNCTVQSEMIIMTTMTMMITECEHHKPWNTACCFWPINVRESEQKKQSIVIWLDAHWVFVVKSSLFLVHDESCWSYRYSQSHSHSMTQHFVYRLYIRSTLA